MLTATIVVAIHSPVYLAAAFNPITLNLGVIALAIVGWVAAGSVPSASRCLRKPLKEKV